MSDLPSVPVAHNPFTAADVISILREQSWFMGEANPEHTEWFDRAAFLLGPQSSDRTQLKSLLELVFHYDAAAILAKPDAQAAMSRKSARDVVRRLALLILDGPAITSEGFSEIVTALKNGMDVRSRDLFHPIRLALAGQTGEGELDRVILLLDTAAALPFAVNVKSARVRILEFCAALD
jgi:glutamyl/glutaminyl-tRNA synthetase